MSTVKFEQVIKERTEKVRNMFARRKLKLKFNPYTYVRASVMRTLLLRDEDYETMLKLDVEEIMNFLQSKGYEQFSKLRMQYSGTELLEQAIRLNLKASFDKLKRISDDNLVKIIEAYLMRYDVANIKLLIRIWKQELEERKTEKSNTKMIMFDNNNLKNLFFPTGKYDVEFYERLADSGYERGIKLLKKTEFGFISDFFEKLSLFEIESRLDRAYYNSLFSLSKKIKGKGGMMRLFIDEELMAKNILVLFKLKGEDFKGLMIDANKALIFPKGHKRLLRQLIEKKTVDELIDALKKTKYNVIAVSLEKSRQNIAVLEHALQKLVLKRVTHFSLSNIISVDTIFAYLFKKEIEAKNIAIIYKSKLFNVSTEEIRSRIVV